MWHEYFMFTSSYRLYSFPSRLSQFTFLVFRHFKKLVTRPSPILQIIRKLLFFGPGFPLNVKGKKNWIGSETKLFRYDSFSGFHFRYSVSAQLNDLNFEIDSTLTPTTFQFRLIIIFFWIEINKIPNRLYHERHQKRSEERVHFF